MTRPVAVRVSQATRLTGSSVRQASRMASEIWSAILSGWPSVTDSEVNKKRFLDGKFVCLLYMRELLVRAIFYQAIGARPASELTSIICRRASGNPTGRVRRGTLGGSP